jgi:hypothetical protein
MFARLLNQSEISAFKRKNAERSNKMSALVHAYIKSRQEPDDCETANKLFCDIDVRRSGFGSTVESNCQCLMLALYFNRTLILNSTGWNYDARGLEPYFEPITTCKSLTVTERKLPLKGANTHRISELLVYLVS